MNSFNRITADTNSSITPSFAKNFRSRIPSSMSKFMEGNDDESEHQEKVFKDSTLIDNVIENLEERVDRMFHQYGLENVAGKRFRIGFRRRTFLAPK